MAKSLSTLTIWNTQLTPIEVKKLMSYKGAIQYPNTEHNRKAIAAHMDKHLTKLRKQRDANK